MRLSRRSIGSFALAAALAFAWSAESAAAPDSAAWTACQGRAAAADLDQLVDRCATSAGCQGAGDAVDLDRLTTGCTAVMQSPTEPPLVRALAAYQRGMADASRGDNSQAINDFSFAIRLRPDFAAADERRGAVFAANGDDVHAILDFGAAIKLDPSLVRAYSARAQAYFRMRDYDSAIADLGRVLTLRPDDPVALNNRCYMRAASGRDLAAALDDCNQLVRLQPGAAAPLDSRGLVHIRLKDFGGAIIDYNAALAANSRLDEVRASSLYGRGLARKAIGDRADGDADFAAAVAITPSIAQTYADLGLRP